MSVRSIFSPRPTTAPRITRGHRVYAIGDIHGRDDLLADLLPRIERDNHDRSPAKTLVVFLGDLIDRGPASAQVVERLLGWKPDGMTPLFLLGNHEEVLLRILRGEGRLMSDWLRFGGSEFLASYGIDGNEIRKLNPVDSIARIRAAIPQAHIGFLESFEDTVRIGDYLFVHAGIRPGLPLDRQVQSDLRWIRAPFLDSKVDHGFVVVHGHTISSDIDRRANRIGIDTAAYASGKLTALGLEGENQWIIQTVPGNE